MSNCDAWSKIHLDRLVHVLSRSSSNALANSSECEFELPVASEDADDVNNLDKLGLVSEAALL